MPLFLKLAMVAAVVGTIFFLAYIYPNIKTPKWSRKLISAKYLRDRQHFDLADTMLEETIKQYPNQMQLYLVYKKYYSTPEDMKRIYDVLAAGYEKSRLPGVGVMMAELLIEEGDFEKASSFLNTEEAKEFMLTNNLPLESKLSYRMGKYEEAEKSFIDFYKKINPGHESEKELFADLTPEELMPLVQIRSKISDDWKNTMKYKPFKSMMDEDDWSSLLEELEDKKSRISVTSGIYGPVEKLFDYRINNLEEQIKLIQNCK